MTEPNEVLFHEYAGRDDNGRARCVCGWVCDHDNFSENDAQHSHAAHAWVAEPYMTA